VTQQQVQGELGVGRVVLGAAHLRHATDIPERVPCSPTSSASNVSPKARRTERQPPESQDELKQQVNEQLTVDGCAELGPVGEVERSLAPW
jgi:hypothetical protein